jgi:hypothetical protein
MASELAIEWLGTVPYREALELQEKSLEARRAGPRPTSSCCSNTRP